MWFVFAIQLINVLLRFQPVTSYSCEQADWQVSLNRIGWSKCPKVNTYLRGLWRDQRHYGDERVGRIEFGKCCSATEPSYANQPANCSNANWKYTMDGPNVWALCPIGYYLNGLELDRGPPAFLNSIDKGQCCHPQNHPKSYEHCYDEDVSVSFDDKGWSECKKDGYYMTGFYKSTCNNLGCIEKFKCCKMKKVDGGWSSFGSWSSCSANCGGGTRERRRTCTKPPPSNGGKCCVGDNLEVELCNPEACGYKVDGEWSKWSEFSECSKTCGKGKKTRSRTCTNPPPSGGGENCKGKGKDTKSCNPKKCPGRYGKKYKYRK